VSRTVQIRTLLEARQAAEGELIHRIVRGYLRRRDQLPPEPAGAAPLWGPDHFNLQRSTLFCHVARHQHDILAACGQALLREAYFIEKAGLAFCAKMVLLAETMEERQAYALMGADEATHLAWITPWIVHMPLDHHGLFLGLVADLVEHGRRDSLAYLLQIVLEGWGIAHYRALAADCRDPSLATRFAAMASQEALHCATGAAVFRPERMAPDERSGLLDAMAQFIDLIRAGPQAVVATMAETLGGLNRARRVELFLELDAEAATAVKLARLRRLMTVPGMEWAIEVLDQDGRFTPLSAEACAELSAA
jgi:hypothetical protein